MSLLTFFVVSAYAKSSIQSFSPEELPTSSDWFYIFFPCLFIAEVLLFGFVAILKLRLSLCTWI